MTSESPSASTTAQAADAYARATANLRKDRKLGVIVTRQHHGAGYCSQPYYYSYDDSGARVRKRVKQKA